MVGELELTINSSIKLFWLSYQAFALVVELITGLIIFYNSHKVDDISVRWKGGFLLTAFNLFTVAALMDAALTMNVALLIIVRILLIASVINFHFGFLLPNSLLNKLAKQTG